MLQPLNTLSRIILSLYIFNNLIQTNNKAKYLIVIAQDVLLSIRGIKKSIFSNNKLQQILISVNPNGPNFFVCSSNALKKEIKCKIKTHHEKYK